MFTFNVKNNKTPEEFENYLVSKEHKYNVCVISLQQNIELPFTNQYLISMLDDLLVHHYSITTVFITTSHNDK